MRLSIVIPVLNEAAILGDALRRLRDQAPDAERIVVDGGSDDLSASLARPFAQVVSAPRGRAIQLNAGARLAQGDWLLFLHADTQVEDGFQEEMGQAEAKGLYAGAFRLRIEGRHPLLPLLAWGANWRTRRHGIVLGDQGLFMRRELFSRLGGFPDLPLMEDYAMSLRLRRDGVRLYQSPLAATTSGRRWDKDGFLRVWWAMRRNYRRFDRDGTAAGLAQGYPDTR